MKIAATAWLNSDLAEEIALEEASICVEPRRPPIMGNLMHLRQIKTVNQLLNMQQSSGAKFVRAKTERGHE